MKIPPIYRCKIETDLSREEVFAFFLVFGGFALDSLLRGQASGWFDIIFVLLFMVFVWGYFLVVSKKIVEMMKMLLNNA